MSMEAIAVGAVIGTILTVFVMAVTATVLDARESKRHEQERHERAKASVRARFASRN